MKASKKTTDLEKQKKSLEEFDVTDGKTRDEKAEQIKKARELEDLLGIKDMNPFRTLNKNIFAENLSSMSIADMTSLCNRVGINPPRSQNQMRKALSEAFDMYAQKHNVTVPSPSKPIIDKNSPNYDSVVRLFTD